MCVIYQNQWTKWNGGVVSLLLRIFISATLSYGSNILMSTEWTKINWLCQSGKAYTHLFNSAYITQQEQNNSFFSLIFSHRKIFRRTLFSDTKFSYFRPPYENKARPKKLLQYCMHNAHVSRHGVLNIWRCNSPKSKSHFSTFFFVKSTIYELRCSIFLHVPRQI